MQLGNVFPNSALAMQAILDLHFPEGRILDVTYGHGTFYRRVQREVVGCDIRQLPELMLLSDARAIPLRDDSADVAVLDPPYKRGGRAKRNDFYVERYGEAPDTEPRVTRLYLDVIPELLRVARLGMILKCQDAADGHSFHPRHIQLCSVVQELTRLRLHDFACVVRKTVPRTVINGRQHYFRQHVSFFLIWKWSSKYPFRPVRF